MSIPRRLPEIGQESDVEAVYSWVDSIPLSRPKRNIARDFSDAVMLAELIQCARPELIEMHNYVPSGSVSQKLYNWSTLNMKVLRRLGFQVHEKDLEECAQAKPGAIEKVLVRVKACLEKMPPVPASKPVRPISAIVESPPVVSPQPDRPAPTFDHERIIEELRHSNSILSQKNAKLEQLVEIKNKKIEALQSRLS